MLLLAVQLLALAGCATVDLGPGASTAVVAPAPPASVKSADAVPRIEPLHPTANATYAAQGRWFSPITDDAPFTQKGEAMVYGDRAQGKLTASGEAYDPSAMTAAHARLPIPSYARVTNPRNGISVIVRINDRGAFERESAIQLSAAAAARLDVRERGVVVEVAHLTRADIARMAPNAQAPVAALNGAALNGAAVNGAAAAATNRAMNGAMNAAVSETSSGGAVAVAPPTPQPIAAPPVESAPVPLAVPALPPPAVAPMPQIEAADPSSAPATRAPVPAANLAVAPAAAVIAAAPGSGRWSVQVGIFAIPDNADAVRKRVAAQLAERAADLPLSDRTPWLEPRGAMTAVIVGNLPDRNGAAVFADRLRGVLRQDVVLVQH